MFSSLQWSKKSFFVRQCNSTNLPMLNYYWVLRENKIVYCIENFRRSKLNNLIFLREMPIILDHLSLRHVNNLPVGVIRPLVHLMWGNGPPYFLNFFLKFNFLSCSSHNHTYFLFISCCTSRNLKY